MRKLLIIVAMAAGLGACCRHHNETTLTTCPGSTTVLSELIPVDSANKMLGSYLSSIDYAGNDSTLRSISLDACMLRDYLNSLEGQELVGVKVMFAHTLDYINAGHVGEDAGYRSGALTLLLAGYDESGNYYLPENGIFNKGVPCPTHCPPGAAGNPFIPTTITTDTQ